MKMIDLALKDISQMLRDKRSLLFLVAMPIIFTLFMGFAYRGSSPDDKAADTRISLALVDPQPESRLSKMFAARLASSAVIRTVSMSEAAAMEAFHNGQVAGVLLVPSGFGEKAQGQLKLIAQAGSSQGQSFYQSLRLPISELFSAVEIAHISADVQAKPEEYAPSLALAWNKWEANANIHLVRVEQAVAKQAQSEDWTGGNPYNQSSPGILVQFAIFGLMTSAQILVQERKSRTMQRLMTTAMRPWQIVAGHLLAMFALTFLQSLPCQ